MRIFLTALVLGLSCGGSLFAEEKTAALPATETILPLGRPFQPRPVEPLFLAVSKQCLYVFASRDDGLTWKQVFVGDPKEERAGGHGAWALYSGVAYSNGVFGLFTGWGVTSREAGGRFIGSDDGVHWRHLAKAPAPGTHFANAQPQAPAMPNAFCAAADPKGAFVATGYGAVLSSRDYGLTWTVAANTKGHHQKVAYGSYDGGRFVVVGDGPTAYYSKDRGQTWIAGDISVADREFHEDSSLGMLGERRFALRSPCSRLVFGNGVFLLPVDQGRHVLRSADGGATWSKHPLGGEAGYDQGFTLIDGEFWLTGKKGRRSKDGLTWTDLPASVPTGQIYRSDKGSYLCIARRSIQRSVDAETWTPVFTPGQDDLGRDIQLQFGAYGLVNTPATNQPE